MTHSRYLREQLVSDTQALADALGFGTEHQLLLTARAIMAQQGEAGEKNGYTRADELYERAHQLGLVSTQADFDARVSAGEGLFWRAKGGRLFTAARHRALLRLKDMAHQQGRTDLLIRPKSKA